MSGYRVDVRSGVPSRWVVNALTTIGQGATHQRQRQHPVSLSAQLPLPRARRVLGAQRLAELVECAGLRIPCRTDRRQCLVHGQRVVNAFTTGFLRRS